MLKNVKFSLKSYLLLTCIGALALLLFEGLNLHSAILVMSITLASTANHLILYFAMRSVVLRQAGLESGINSSRFFSLKIGSLLVLKMIILGGTFYMAVEMFREKILIALLMYIFELIVFVLSIKNKLK